MAFEPTVEQRQAITAKGTILVSAAAGSGKTAVLVERVISMLLDERHPVDADRLLVVTFTKAAAAEMRMRIAGRIADEITKQPQNKRLLRQQILFSKAAISTIDSFCLDLVREHFDKLDIGMDFKIIDMQILHQLRETALETTLEKYYVDESKEFFALLEMVGADFGDAGLREAVLSIYESLRSLPFPGKYIEKVLTLYETQEITKSVWAQEIYAYVESLFSGILTSLETAVRDLSVDEKLSKAYMPSFKQAYLELQRIQERIGRKEWDEIFIGLKNFAFDPLKSVSKPPNPELKEQMKSLRKTIADQVKKLSGLFPASAEDLQEDIIRLRPYVQLLFQFTKDFSDELDRLKRERKQMDFADIEYAALSLLVEKRGEEIQLTDTARTLHERYHEVLVDEYQDTNDLQDSIFYALSNEGRNLFMVGDVKQSIYRFRQANPENFLNRRRTYPLYDGEHSPARIVLKHNFRSREGICDAVNFFFRLLMTERVGEMNYTKEEELASGAKFPERKDADVTVRIVDSTGLKEDSTVLEARSIARYIQGIMASGKMITDHTVEGGLRPAKFKDFTILLRSASNKAKTYLKELRDAGIPAWADLRGGFLEAGEIVTILSFLRCLSNPLLDVPLLSVFRSPIFAFTDEELAEIRMSQKDTSFYLAVLNAVKNGHTKCERAVGLLDRLRRFAATVTTGRLIQKIYEETGYLSLVQAMEDGAQRRANLLLLLDYANSFEQAGNKGLTGFLRSIEKTDQNTSGLDPASVVTEADDVVRIMNIHRSKGLQFPICIIASTGTKFNRSDQNQSFLLSEKLGFGMMIREDKLRKRYTTLPRQAISVQTQIASASEELRVLYVAMTRAQENLVLSMCEENPMKLMNKLARRLESEWSGADDPIDPATVLTASGFDHWILMCALLHPSGEKLREMADVPLTPGTANAPMEIQIVPGESVLELEPRKDPETCRPDEKLLEEIDRRLRYKYPYEALGGVASKRTATQIAAGEIDEEFICSSRPAFMSKTGLSPSERGTALHQFMQFADYAAADENLKKELERLVEKKYLTPEQSAGIDPKKVRQFFNSPLYKRMSSAEKQNREYRFMVEMNASQADPSLSGFVEEKIVVQGIVDLLFYEPDGIVIVDYKTDRVTSADYLIEHYAPQLAIYAKAIEKTLNTPVKQCLIYSFALGQQIPVEF